MATKKKTDDTQATEEAASAAAEGDTNHLRAVADALAAAAEAVEDSEGDTMDTEDLPAGALGRAVYRTCYCLSYGVVFPTVLLTSVLPTENAIGHGLADGARAARDALDAMRARRQAAKAAEDEAAAVPEAAPAPA